MKRASIKISHHYHGGRGVCVEINVEGQPKFYIMKGQEARRYNKVETAQNAAIKELKQRGYQEVDVHDMSVPVSRKHRCGKHSRIAI